MIRLLVLVLLLLPSLVLAQTGVLSGGSVTSGGMNIAFTSPTGNTDTFHAVCEGHDAETQ